jgi:hypothetical protein
MAVSSSLNPVDPRPQARRIQVLSGGLTTASNNYSAGDQIGTAFVFNNASRVSAGTGTITTATLLDKGNVVGATDLYLFTQAVTPAADNSAASFSDADMMHYVGTLSFPGPANLNNNRAVTLPAVGLTYKTTSTTLYGYLVSLTNNNFFSAADDIVITLMVYQY